MSDFAEPDQQPDQQLEQQVPQSEQSSGVTPAVFGGDEPADDSEAREKHDGKIQEAEQLTDNPVPHAPEAYDINYGQPGGVDPYLDRQFRSFAHENGISGELAQKLVDFNNQLESSRMQEQQLQAEAWEKQTRELPGWQGRNYRQNMGVANRALQAFASPALAEMIRSSGYSCHPEVVKTFYNVGKRLSEDSYVDSNMNTPRKKTIGEILYPNQPV